MTWQDEARQGSAFRTEDLIDLQSCFVYSVQAHGKAGRGRTRRGSARQDSQGSRDAALTYIGTYGIHTACGTFVSEWSERSR